VHLPECRLWLIKNLVAYKVHSLKRACHKPENDVTIEDDEIRIDSLESLIALLHETEHAERAGAPNQDRKRELVSLSEEAYQRVVELERELEAVYEMAGKPTKASK
jgi:hypothetical protein